MGNISEKSVPVPKRPGRATIIPIQIQGEVAGESRQVTRQVATGREIATSPWKYRRNNVQYISGFETPTTAGITNNEQISNTRRKR